MLKRYGLLLLVNFGIIITISLVLNLLGVNHYLTARGINYESLIIFCLVWGLGGSFISLMMSKTIAKWTMSLQIIQPNDPSSTGQKLLAMITRLSKSAQLPKNPEFALYDSPEINAFATGPSKSNSLVAVSTGLLRSMNDEEIEGVLAHEVSHIANGDMITMTLLQGVINAFVMFFSKVAAWAIANSIKSDDDDGAPSFWLVFAIEMVFTVVFAFFGMLVVSYFSRFREYKADKGAAQLSGREKIISALESLKRNIGAPEDPRGEALQNFKISSGKRKSFLDLLRSHPSLDDRIKALRSGSY